MDAIEPLASKVETKEIIGDNFSFNSASLGVNWYLCYISKTSWTDSHRLINPTSKKDGTPRSLDLHLVVSKRSPFQLKREFQHIENSMP